MTHRLEAEVTLSGPVADPKAFGPLLERTASEALQRTVGSRGEGRLAEWSLSGDRLALALETSGPRPHQALLALVRRLGEELGRSQKVGVRSFRAPRYRTQFSVGSPPKKPVELPIPHRLTHHGSEMTLELTELSEAALRDNWMDRTVALVREKIERQNYTGCLLYTSPSPRDPKTSRMPSSA